MKIVDIIRNGDFQTIKFDNGSEVYGASEQDENGMWIDNRAIDYIVDLFDDKFWREVDAQFRAEQDGWESF